MTAGSGPFKIDGAEIDSQLLQSMDLVREVVTLGLAIRAKNRLKVRMPLQALELCKEGVGDLGEELKGILEEELNVKSVRVVKELPEREGWGRAEDGGTAAALDLKLTEELELEGYAREVIRQIQSMRKNAAYRRDDAVSVRYELAPGADKLRRMFETWGAEIRKECALSDLAEGKEAAEAGSDGRGELEFEGQKLILTIKK
jgi:hypothetical protein